MKKSILILAVIAALLLSMTACGGKQSAADDTGTPAQSTPPETVDDSEEAGPMMGAYDAESGVYTNEFLGLRCELDADWEVFSVQQIAELQGLMAEITSDEALAEQINKSGNAMVFYAQAEGGYVTLNITVEDLGFLYGALLSEEEYAKQAIEIIAPALESMGMSDVSSEATSVRFAGEAHAAVAVHGSLETVDFFETMVCVKVGKYLALVTAASYMTDVTGDVLEMFDSL